MLLAAWLVTLFVTDNTADAQTAKHEGWFRLRTNSVPYQPKNVAVDTAGGVWVTSPYGHEYTPGVWYRPPGADPFRYLTNSRINNLVGAAFNAPVVKPQLEATVRYAVRDKGGNTWYALENRKVLCEKADGTWLTFAMPDSTTQYTGDTTNVDSAHLIRLIDKADGTQERLLIARRGIVRINAALEVVETRAVYEIYNNYFIEDALIDSRGRTWVASGMGLEKGTTLTQTTYVKDLYPTDPAAPATTTAVSRILEDPAGNIWFGSNFGHGVAGIFCFTAAGVWVKHSSGAVADIGMRVHDIAATHDGSVWFGAVYSGAGGLLRYAPSGGGQWTRYTTAQLGLQSGEILGLASDGAGIWFTTGYNPSIPGHGTGVHRLTINAQGQPEVIHFTYRGSSTTLTSLTFYAIAADLSGGVWFPAYDDPSIARLKVDGSWQQFRAPVTPNLGSFGFAGVAANSRNRVYFAPTNAAPIAYDVAAEHWLTLPVLPFSNRYYYGVYVDPQDGVWFHGARFVYYLDPNHTGWVRYSSTEVPLFPDDNFDGVLADDAGNVWFIGWRSITLMKKDPQGGAPAWFKFVSGDASGYTGGYRVFIDDLGQIWNAAKQKFDTQANTWALAADTTAFDRRNFRFLNGRVPVTLDLTGAPAPVGVFLLNDRTMTVDRRGTIYFSGGISNVGAGIVALGPLNGDIDRSGRVDLADAVLAIRVLTGVAVQAPAAAEWSGDGRIGPEEAVFILQRLAGLR